MQLWEILVPTVRPNGKPIRLRFHRVWDTRVRELTCGLTIHPPTKGVWVSPAGQLFEERMIPVRIACTTEQIHAIADMTAAYYEQQAVMFYQVSDEVHIKQYPCKSSMSVG